jgi:signal peptidase I
MRKHARELLKGTRKLLRMHRDILEDRHIRYLNGLCNDLRVAIYEDRPHLIIELSEKLDKTLAKVFPQGADASWRENVEVFLVAAIVAMAIRSFFIQPFKIPTGSMQPTLYGLYELRDYNRSAALPQRILDCVLLGKWPTSQQAKPAQSVFNFLTWIVLGKWPYGATCVMRGDHIFVDRFTYHFRRPQRGDVVVFETNDVYDLPESHRNKFYIKRLIGLGGDHVQIKPPHVLVNGDVLDSRKIFQRIYSCENGYNGYVIPESFPPAKYIANQTDVYQVPEKQYFVMGDNSRSSLDGRFFGSFARKALIGRAILVYWPFTMRFGVVQ